MATDATYGAEWPPVYHLADARVALPDDFRRGGFKLDLVAESTPYLWKRKYTDGDQHAEWGGWTLEHFIADHVAHARLLWHVVKPNGWYALNLGDTRSNTGGAGGDANAAGQRIYRPGDIHLEGAQQIGVPWRVATAIQERTPWRLQGYVVWNKKRPVRTDNSAHHFARNRRPGNQHEFVFLFARTARSPRPMYWDPTYLESIKERGDVWDIATTTRRPPWATESDDTPPWPDELVRRLVLTLTPQGGRVADFVGGYGTTARVANELGRVGYAFDPFTCTASWPGFDPGPAPDPDAQLFDEPAPTGRQLDDPDMGMAYADPVVRP